VVVSALVCLGAGPAAALAPSRQYAQMPAELGLVYVAVQLATEDSLALDAWWFPGKPGASAVVIAGPGHGNQGDLLPAVRELQKRGFAVLTFDYRGFGPRGAGPTDTLRRMVYSSAFVADAAAALRWTREKIGPRGYVFIYGREMGSAAALAACVRTGGADAVVADGLFRASADYLRATGLAQDPKAVELRKRYVLEADEPLASTQLLKAPLFVIMAERDSLLPQEDALVAARQAKVRLDLWVIPGAGHDEAPRQPGYYERLVGYFRRLQAIPKAG
jgi:pimeloyl-ACP methyl ester carboxylesterase